MFSSSVPNITRQPKWQKKTDCIEFLVSPVTTTTNHLLSDAASRPWRPESKKKVSLALRNTEVRGLRSSLGLRTFRITGILTHGYTLNEGQESWQYFVTDDVYHVFNFSFFRFTLHVYWENMTKTSLWTRYKKVGGGGEGFTAQAPLTSEMDGGERSVKSSRLIHWAVATGALHVQ